MKVTKLHCSSCDITVKGSFVSDRYSGFSQEELSFMEAFVIASGSLKELQQTLSISYPTVRSKLDGLVVKMQGLHDSDKQNIQQKEQQKEEAQFQNRVLNNPKY